MADVRPVLVRVPEQLCDQLTAEASERGVSRHALIVERLGHECPTEMVCASCGATTREVHAPYVR